jgi:hypothetical protein
MEVDGKVKEAYLEEAVLYREVAWAPPLPGGFAPVGKTPLKAQGRRFHRMFPQQQVFWLTEARHLLLDTA